MRRLTILLAALGALMLVPAAQAFALGTLHVNVAGSGQGEVSSVGGIGVFKSESAELNELFESFGNANEGLPPIQCSGPPSAGTCATELEGAIESIGLHAVAAPGSEFVGWVVNEGYPAAGCVVGGPLTAEGENPNFCAPAPQFINENVEVTATFNAKTGSTNRRTLTITKSAGGTEGIGTVKSKPKGINCATACNSAVASLYKEVPVTLTAKAANGSSFVKWENANEGGACDESASVTCTVPMKEDEALTAVFGGTSKAIAEPTELTVSKGGSTGFGAVKGTGLSCEAECTATTVLYQGPIGGPKPKPAKTVVLSQVPAYGSEFDGWSGCDSVAEGKCTVTMEEATEVTAEYTAKPNVALTIEKGGTGTGTITSKPKGLKCAATCTTQAMAVPSGEAVVLKAKAASGMTFTGWSVEGEPGLCTGAPETCTVSPAAATKVTASFSGTPKPILSPTELTLTKAGTGFGTVKASGLACEALCTTATSIYQGTIELPKPKPAKTVILEAFQAPGSQAVVWSGCDSEEAGKCVVTMSEAKEVTATFEELE